MTDGNATKDDFPASQAGLTRRAMLKYSASAFGGISIGAIGSGGNAVASPPLQYPISGTVRTTAQRMISFSYSLQGLAPQQICEVAQYDRYGYGQWNFGAPLPSILRMDIMAPSYGSPLPSRKTKLLNFFTLTDVHITDKEAPNQLIYFQQTEPAAYHNTSVYSPVMLYSTQVLDAAVQTVNALHRNNPFDFGLCLGDVCNSSSYKELRWFIDVMDGRYITPSSGAHAGARTIDYQMPYKAAGLDPSIPWYQALGNHDHFYLGSFPIDADPSLGFRASYVADTVWKVGDVLVPDPSKFPALFNVNNLKKAPLYFTGVIDGSTQYGNIIDAGAGAGSPFAGVAPKIAPDPERHAVTRTEFMREFFNTTTQPAGHGFNLVQGAAHSGGGFACYSFTPKSRLPIKVIVLDDTQFENDGSNDIHGHGYLDARRWTWLKSELAQGQANDQLMIIAAHIPIGVSAIGSDTEWWAQTANIAPANQNAVSLTELVTTLRSSTNLIAWLAGHRHLNTVKAFKSADPQKPEQGFWQVETSSFRDFPQQFRTFEIYLNSDYTVSIVTVNVDPAVADGTPAATARKYAIAVQQIVQNDMTRNNPNYRTANGEGVLPVPTMDPSRLQNNQTDPTIQFVDLSTAQPPVPYNASYNAELFKQLSPKMVAALRRLFP
jgi:metallophosphoesterase (TIGR03768 family)